MAKVEYADMIKTVSGALVKINKKSQHAADQKMVLATHRVAPSQSRSCSKIFLRGLSAVTRKTEASQRELNNRARFVAVHAMVKARARNLEYLATDQEAFLAQKDLPGGKTTLQAYYWKICGEQYDAQHGN